MKRVITAAVAIPLVLSITLFAPNWIFSAIVGVIAAMAAEEFFSLGAKKGIGRPGQWFLAPAALVGFSFFGGAGWVLTTFVSAILVLMTVSIFGGAIDSALGHVAIGLAAIAYCSLTLGFLIWMPRKTIVLLFLIIWVGDTAAYYGGRAFGHHLLAPRVSPKKTVEGAVLGLVGSVAAGAIGGVWILGQPWMKPTEIALVTAIVGQLGDLAESVLKRSAGVKDSSSILPGHGGILDRLDSLLLAAPVFYWLFTV